MKAYCYLRKTLVIMAAAVFVALLATSSQAFAQENVRGMFTTAQDKGVQTAIDSYASPYALYKADGYLYRCDSKGNALSNGRMWGESASDNIRSITTLFIDSNVKRLSGVAKFDEIRWGSTRTSTAEFDGWIYGDHLISLHKIIFKLDANKKNACTSIADSAFYDSPVSQIVNMEKTAITTINNFAFKGCKSLTSFKFPATLASMGQNVFTGCSSLRSVSFPKKLAEIPYHAFDGCTALKTVTFGSGVASLGSGAFQKCTSLTKVDLPKTLTNIDNSAFSGCSQLKTVYMRAASKVSVGYSAFSGTPLGESTGAKNGAWFYVPSKLLASYRADEWSNSWRGYKDHFKAIPGTAPKDKAVYWLINKRTGENLYTTDVKEVNTLSKVRKTWTNKGIMWYAPLKGQPVYRLYNPKTGDHHFTKNANEVRVLTKVKKTWKADFNGKPIFYSGGSKNVWRQYSDSRQKAGKPGTHKFTTTNAKLRGWKNEGALLKATRYK